MIRHAKDGDFENIVLLRKLYLLDVDQVEDSSYRWKMQRSGFIGSMSEVEFNQDLHHLFLVSEDESGITGYLRIDRDHEYKDNDKKIWIVEGAKENYFTGHHAEIGMIGVREDKKRQGIARELLEHALVSLREKEISYLFSIVVVSPLSNFPSMMFHERNAFDRVAISVPHYHFDLHNYQSLLYRKTV